MEKLVFQNIPKSLRLRCFHELYRLYAMHSKPYRVPFDLMREVYEALKCRQDGPQTLVLHLHTEVEVQLVLEALRVTPQNLVAALPHVKKVIATPSAKLIGFSA